MLGTEEAIIRVAHKLCNLDLHHQCPQPCAKHTAEARVTVFTLLDAAAKATDTDLATVDGFEGERATVDPDVLDNLSSHRRKYNVTKVEKTRGYNTAIVETLEESYDWHTADLVSSESYHDEAKKRKYFKRFRPAVKTHLPVFDIDFEAKLLPSTQEHHYHLFLDKQISWRKYKRVLRAMYKAGLIEKGWYLLCVKRGMGTLWYPNRKSALYAVKRGEYGGKQKVKYLSSY